MTSPLPSTEAGLDSEADDVRLAQAKLGGVLDRDHALRRLDPSRERVEESGLAGSRSSCDENGAPLAHRRFQDLRRERRQRSRGDELVRTGTVARRSGGWRWRARPRRAAGRPRSPAIRLQAARRPSARARRRGGRLARGSARSPRAPRRRRRTRPASARCGPRARRRRARARSPSPPRRPGSAEQVLERPEADRLAHDELASAPPACGRARPPPRARPARRSRRRRRRLAAPRPLRSAARRRAAPEAGQRGRPCGAGLRPSPEEASSAALRLLAPGLTSQLRAGLRPARAIAASPGGIPAAGRDPRAGEDQEQSGDSAPGRGSRPEASRQARPQRRG